MITFYSPGLPSTRLDEHGACSELTRSAGWIDLFEPTEDEEKTLEAALGINIPTREEMQEIELSSRLYEEDGNLFLTATVLAKADSNNPQSAAITFILSADKLVTLRYSNPTAFAAFHARREANVERYQTNYQFMAGLIDAIVERLADILEGVGASLDRISLRVFDAEAPDGTSQWDSEPTKKRGKSRRTRQRRTGSGKVFRSS